MYRKVESKSGKRQGQPMKLLKQQILYYKEDNSDKVYEIDLCEVNHGKFVVNFRYGKRGTSLKDGTKTILPVNREEAEKIYTRLLAEKMKKGYRESLEAFTGKEKQAGSSSKADGALGPDSRNSYLIEQITRIAAEIAAGKYKADKHNQRRHRHMIINAGVLKLAEVERALVSCLGRGAPLLDYAIAHALGQLSQDKAQTIAALVKLYQKTSTPEFVKRIAVEAMQILSDAPGDFKEHLIKALPVELRTRVNGHADALYEVLKTYLNPGMPQSFEVLYKLYQIDNLTCRQTLLRLLAEVPLQPLWFRQVRYIFKAAEYRRDIEFYALLAYRFAMTRAMWDNHRYYHGLRINGKYYSRKQVMESLKKGESLAAYSSRTRLYLRRRVVRTLRHLGEIQAPGYVPIACALLAHYKDADGGKPFTSRGAHWRYDRTARRSYRVTSCTYYDSFAHFLDFNYILYHNSPRYILKGRTYRYKPGYQPGKPAPAEREEAFPALWDQYFRVIPPLLGRSRCERVHEFGVKVLQHNPEFLAQPQKEEALVLLRSPYLVSAELGMVIVDKVLQQHPADSELITSLLLCISPQAREKGRQQLINHPGIVTNELILALLFSPFQDARQYIASFINRFPLPIEQAEALLGQIFSRLILSGKSAETPEQALKEQLADIRELLLVHYRSLCAELAEEVILDLINHPAEPVQELGAKILLIHNQYATAPPDRILQVLLKSQFPAVMGLGVQLFGQLPDTELMTRELALKEFLLHPLAEVQQQARPILKKLVTLNVEFAGRFLSILLSYLFRLKDEDKIRFLVQVIREDFRAVKELPQLLIKQMLRSPSTAIQELGGHFLSHSGLQEQLTVDEMVELADKDALNVRQIAWKWCETHPQLIRQNLEKAVKLLDAVWDDTREFAFRFIETGFSTEDFSPMALVGICDSTREDVQQFGKKMIMQHFQEQDGADYLVKLSEHPSRGIQFFVTNLLEKYAAGNPERIARLTDYMSRVLLSVNRASAAKERILHFIGQEADRNRETAVCLVPLLASLTGTISVTYRDQALAILTRICYQYPDLPPSLKIIDPEVRNVV